MTQFKKLLDDILAEASKKPTHMAPKTAAIGKAKLPKPDSESHNPEYHQDEPVQFEKPKEPSLDKDGQAKPEPEQKDVLDRMEKQAHIAVGGYGDENDKLTEAQKFRRMQNRLKKAVAQPKKKE